MGWLDRLFGRKDEPLATAADAPWSGAPRQGTSASDEQALERYRYMVQTAPPETIERAHEEAFSKLTPQQRAQALRELTRVTPAEERAAESHSDDPRSLARLATRAELREPGTMQRTFGGGGVGSGGGMGMGSTIFTSLAAGFVGSMIAQQFFDSVGSDFPGGGAGHVVDSSDASGSAGEDFGGGDFGSDFGGDF